MKPPSLTDRAVKVRAYLSDEDFGYEHWHARQFSAPEDAKPALLLVFEMREERDAAYARVVSRAQP